MKLVLVNSVCCIFPGAIAAHTAAVVPGFDADVTLVPFAAGNGRSYLRFVVMNAGDRSRFPLRTRRDGRDAERG